MTQRHYSASSAYATKKYVSIYVWFCSCKMWFAVGIEKHAAIWGFYNIMLNWIWVRTNFSQAHPCKMSVTGTGEVWLRFLMYHGQTFSGRTVSQSDLEYQSWISPLSYDLRFQSSLQATKWKWQSNVRSRDSGYFLSYYRSRSSSGFCS